MRKAKTLNANSSEAEIFNVMGQLQSLQRIKKSGELEQSYRETEKITQHENPKFDFVFLGQSVLKYQVPLDIFMTINHIYEINKNNLR